MGPTSVIFIIALLIVAGIVAWAGDVLGSLLGKRRISLFGLRPRLTSRLVGVLTGVLITVVTILTLALTSQNIQMMLLRMDEIIRENAMYQEENQTLVSENLSLIEGNVGLQQANDDLMTNLYESQEAIDNLSYELSTAQVELNTVNLELDSVNEELDMVTENIEELRSEGADLRDEVGSLTTERNQLVTERDRLTAEAQSLSNRIADLNAEVQHLTGQVQTYEVGEFKVRENQQLAAFYVDTQRDINYIYIALQDKIQSISRDYVDPESGEHMLALNEIEITSEQYVDALDAIREVDSRYAIVIVYATENVVENQPVPVRLEISANTLVYRTGALIFSSIYSQVAEGSEQPYRAMLSQFFEDARDQLHESGSIIPTASGEIMQITVDDLITLSDRLEAAEFPVELRIIAMTDIYRTDFLVFGEQFGVSILPVNQQQDGVEPE